MSSFAYWLCLSASAMLRSLINLLNQEYGWKKTKMPLLLPIEEVALRNDNRGTAHREQWKDMDSLGAALCRPKGFALLCSG